MINEARKLMMELAERQWEYSVVDSMQRSRKPGEIVQRLPDGHRNILKELKSDDIQNIRWPLWK